MDNADLMGYQLRKLIERLSTMQVPPVIVLASRYNLFQRELRDLLEQPNVRLIDIPDLSDADIETLIEKLDTHQQLGRLGPLPHHARVQEFQERADKQILVAMREATRGRGFDDIIRSEFDDIQEAEPRILYLCAALATAERMHISLDQFLACSEASPASTLNPGSCVGA
ncbi:hypothetical protein [Candidatus Palauibacter sp.]|uniref:hypothetical protein n=1 Tax=Candidatus Palauibacter sp. TaxID=3101350 RepID=UPI003C6F6816